MDLSLDHIGRLNCLGVFKPCFEHFVAARNSKGGASAKAVILANDVEAAGGDATPGGQSVSDAKSSGETTCVGDDQ